mmetsp:Transcript_67944/g.136721  ORF Transcript_67944/g.136721 Transcript_67944/m.136721 type:complete len:462 (+) Transcript_67944:27-1412(+)|eukprot:CAMPEP_0171857438 /NCGR_PEP_ID=MMETSP0992-20121227/24694_1 /TAXON_ID=483369 /ORGANISM="non described non described, Strain CCMP2098" /LENGTH=461 /DNA_ID=CAMNT_0012478683 /DNA_START=27 /DNA_END=1412 /DNA_ORIENTATION=+
MQVVLALLLFTAGLSSGSAFIAPQSRGFSRQAALRVNALPDSQRVVITGLGPVSGVGLSQDAFFAGLLEGKSSLGLVTRFDPEQYTCQIASQVPGSFVGADYFNNKKSAKSNDRYTHFGVAAARLALDDAKLEVGVGAGVHPERIGVIVGSAFGGMETYEAQTLKCFQQGPKKVSPFTIPALLGNTASGVIGIEFGCKGPNYGVVSACASASHALGESLNAIRRGDADAMVAGGCEAAITPLSFAGFCSMKAMTTKHNDDPTQGSRPFDADRCGFVMGEGAGVVVLESLEHALKRGADIYCEMVGYGASCDAHHITTPAPEGEGLGRAMVSALKSAGVSDLSNVGYVNAHGTSTPYNDKFETMAIKGVFGSHASQLLVSSIKGSTGHTLGAAGGLEAIACAKAIQTGSVPPTINYATPDPDCDLNYVPNVASHGNDIDVALSTNLGFGGHNAAVAFKKLVK